MGAFVSQAIADKLRQYPGGLPPPYQQSPYSRLQEILEAPGPSRPMWQAPVMENQQLLATSMDPSLTPAWRDAVNQALSQNALAAGMAFGGADVTKEELAKWEAENAAYRAKQLEKSGQPDQAFAPGTRVTVRPAGVRKDIEKAKDFTRVLRDPKWEDVPRGGGTVVIPGTPEAGSFGNSPPWTAAKPPTPQHVAVRADGSRWWFWRHPDDLEVQPPQYRYQSMVPSEVPKRMGHWAHIFHDTPEAAEHTRDSLARGSNVPQREAPIMIRMPDNAVPSTPHIGNKFGNAFYSQDRLPLDKVEVEVRDGVWIPVKEWLKRRK